VFGDGGIPVGLNSPFLTVVVPSPPPMTFEYDQTAQVKKRFDYLRKLIRLNSNTNATSSVLQALAVELGESFRK